MCVHVSPHSITSHCTPCPSHSLPYKHNTKDTTQGKKGSEGELEEVKGLPPNTCGFPFSSSSASPKIKALLPLTKSPTLYYVIADKIELKDRE